ncbi:hypothetical protein JB92DRAFT_3103186 [Gautieria morchelliformis]|nr:hypothetical protein JB92DRAFT_3103186 [Gautieria morchelliformis]
MEQVRAALARAPMLLADVGARPPATLYQTHLVTPPEHGSSCLANANPPQRPGTAPVPGTLPVVQMQRNTNPNVSAYQGKARRRHQEPQCPGTGDSSQALLAEDWAVAAAASLVGGVESRGGGGGGGGGGKDKDKDKKGDKDKDKDKKAAGLSQVYMFYRHSLDSLTDIVDKVDGTGTPTDPQRRKRAAKLARFFGVESNCRALFRDVLASLEEGVREEGEEGRLGVDEVEDLLGTLRNLEVRRNELTA